jgi:pimeloyl-ACP methyl ester carboxylesterase
LIGTLVGSLLLFSVAVLAGWLGYSALFINHRLSLPPAIDAERRTFQGARAGLLSYYVDRSGQGRPLVLIHSINAGASAYEMRPIFEQYRGQRPVYAIDLPGFGFSERSEREYSIELYTQAIIDLLAQEVQSTGDADVIALSLSSEFMARAALERPDLFGTIAMISPTGFTERGAENRVQNNAQRDTSDRVLRVLKWPVWSQGLYDLLVSPPSLRYFLQLNFVGSVDQGLLDYAYATTHQPGARWAPFAFVSGKLFSPDIRVSVYEQLRLPVLVLYDQDPNVRFDTLPQTLERSNWRESRIMPTRGLPQWEQMSAVAEALNRFWAAQSS